MKKTTIIFGLLIAAFFALAGQAEAACGDRMCQRSDLTYCPRECYYYYGIRLNEPIDIKDIVIDQSARRYFVWFEINATTAFYGNITRLDVVSCPLWATYAQCRGYWRPKVIAKYTERLRPIIED